MNKYDKIKVTWRGKSNQKSDDFGGRMLAMDGFYQSTSGGFISVSPIDFEPGEDNLTFDTSLGNYSTPIWKSKVNHNDTDGLIITLKYPKDWIDLHLNGGQDIRFTKADIYNNKKLVFDGIHRLPGTLTIEKFNDDGLSPELRAVREMTLAGKGDHRYSALWEALLKGYEKRIFKEGDNPLRNYKGPVELVKLVWGNMNGPEWNNSKDIKEKLNTEELIDYWVRKNIIFDDYIGSRKTNKSVIKSKKSNCYDTSELIFSLLRKIGKKAGILWVRSTKPEGHVIPYFEDRGSFFVMDNGRLNPKGITGPYESLKKIPYIIKSHLR